MSDTPQSGGDTTPGCAALDWSMHEKASSKLLTEEEEVPGDEDNAKVR
jgi:hypothetical protein